MTCRTLPDKPEDGGTDIHLIELEAETTGADQGSNDSTSTHATENEDHTSFQCLAFGDIVD